ncbi:MAG: 3-(methylthio)propionyl-CoA ligase [Ottowia sp.]|nr:3-(methylthio)propionyl-CoA ligase [Ottowia sp.]
MQGLMQEQQLLISMLLKHAERHHSDTEIVSRRVEGDIHRYGYADMARRARKLANALDRAGLAEGDRVASIAWNGYRHMELYFGVSGSGRVMHTINPRMHPRQITWVINHAEDRVVCFDATFLPIVQAVHANCPTVRHWVLLCDADALPPDSGVPGLISYEAWIGGETDTYNWPQLDEHAAAGLCYTSGTTGDPKGALYSHRSTILHAYAGALPDAIGLGAADAMLPVVPMFHVNAWGLPYVAALVGCKVVFPGPAMDGKSLYELMEAEKVTFAAGVPTIWQMLLTHLQDNNLKFSTLQRTIVGGSALPAAMQRTFEDEFGVAAIHAWGMTETSPLGSVARLKNRQLDLPEEEKRRILNTQGRAIFGIDMKIVDDDGNEQPWDGKAFGDLWVRGPWIASAYFKSDQNPLKTDQDGLSWFPTGDVATIDPDGFMHITDRSKDVIKSGGEWISSIDIENVAMSHRGVAMAACIGMPHPKWGERPVVAVVRKPDADVTREQILALYSDKLAKWQIPDDVVFVEEIPLGATGKMQKRKLREQLKDYSLPDLQDL